MSLNQKYTWKDFLNEHPEHREKAVKRTSPEGKKAFESAYKDHIKKHLTDRMAKAEKLIEKAKTYRTELVAKSKEYRTAERKTALKNTNAEIGRVDSAISRHEKFKSNTKDLQKNFK
jgi:hypothetical protein